MNDPWDVKSVRQGHQYQSCMKINGVPLLPPLLSRECRKEMQYYKLLAKEVEKRISILKPYLESDTESDKTEALDLESEEHAYITPLEEKVEATIDFIVDKFSPNANRSESNSHPPNTDTYNSKCTDSQIVIDLNVKIAKDREVYSNVQRSPRHSPEADEVPERDCDYQNSRKKENKLLELETNRKRTNQELIDSIISLNIDNDFLSDREDYIPLHQDGPSSLSSKSFTGSLNELHTETSKETQGPKLIRQSSYTVLKPSPQLLAHLEVESINTGVELSSISMSDSLSKLSLSAKKRKSWDLESAKVKWSSMARELKRKNIVTKTNGASHNDRPKSKTTKPTPQSAIIKSNSMSQDRGNRNISNIKTPKSEPIKSKNGQNSVTNMSKTLPKEAPSIVNKNSNTSSPKEDNVNKSVALISESDDPAARVKELYEKLQKQQLMQMTNLVEKQKREQSLLQQVFEEQNSILLKQLKSVCPKASIEIKQAWGDLKDNDKGPVSLSQLINTSTPENSAPNSPVSKTLTDSKSFINKCDSMLKKSREITNSIKKQTTKPRPVNGARHTADSVQVSQKGASVTKTHASAAGSTSPQSKNTSRKLKYDTPVSSDVEPILTNRTNDTMDDINVTLPSDSECISYAKCNVLNTCKVKATRACSPLRSWYSSEYQRSMEGSIRNLENSIRTTMDSKSSRSSAKHSILYRQPTTRERVAATKIVACAKGYLVRRLLRTERVQATVQTIRDALLCALQLHQDREGIRGADVDLHRRLIQQITAACYTLHDTFVTSSAVEKCAIISADRARRQAHATRQPTPKSARRELREPRVLDCESCLTCHAGSVVSNNEQETFSGDKRVRYSANPQKVPWR